MHGFWRSSTWFGGGWLVCCALWLISCGGPGKDTSWPLGDVPLSESPFGAPQGPSHMGSADDGAGDAQRPPPENGAPAGGLGLVNAVEPRVLSQTPSGDFNGVPTEITVVFNQPMVPLESLEERQPVEILESSPAVSGSQRWVTPEILRLVPDKPLRRATRYTFTVPAGTTSATGQAMLQPHQWSLDTLRPRVDGISPGHAEQGLLWPDNVWTVRFNQPVDLQSVKRHTRLEVQGQPAPFSVFQAPSSPDVVVIKPNSPLPIDTHTSVEISPGVKGLEGPGTMAFAAVYRGQTFGPLEITEVPCDGGECYWEGSIKVGFSSPLAAGVAKHVRLQGLSGDITVSGRHIYVTGRNWKPGRKGTLIVGPGLEDVFGQKLGKAQRYTLQLANISPDYYVRQSTGGVMAPRSPRTIKTEWTSMGRAHIDLARLTPRLAVLAQERFDDFNDVFGGELQPQVSQKNWPTGAGVNRTSTKAWSLAPVVPPGKTGVVLARVSHPKDDYHTKHFLYQVTHLGLITHTDGASTLVWVVLRDKGEPVSEARVELRDGSGELLWSGLSDAQGLARAPGRQALGLGEDTNLYVLASHKGDLAYVRQNAKLISTSYYNGRPQRGSPIEPTVQGEIYTDRGLYKPSQTVHLKGVVRELTPTGPKNPASRLPSGAKVSIQVHDPRHRTLFDEPLQASISALGTFEATFELGAQAPLGNYTLNATLDGGGAAQEALIAGWFEVGAFRAPQFGVSVTPTKTHNRAGQGAEALVEGRYLFGDPMKGAMVQWQVTRQRLELHQFLDLSPAQRQVLDGFVFRDKVGVADQSPSQSGTGNLDEQGRLKVEIPASLGAGMFEVSAEVVGADRQAVTARTRVRVHPADSYGGLRVPGRIVLAGSEVEVEALLVGTDGELKDGVPMTVALESTRHWGQPGKVVAQCALISASNQPSKCVFKPKAAGQYVVRLMSQGSKGQTINITDGLMVYSATSAPGQLDFKFEQSTYKPGQTARLIVRAPVPDAHVLMTVDQEHTVVHKIVQLNGHQGVLSFQVPGDVGASLYVTLTMVTGRRKLPSGGSWKPAVRTVTRKLPISTERHDLSVEVLPDTLNAQAGQTLNVEVVVRDFAQAPVPNAEVSLAAVNQSLFAARNVNPSAGLWGHALPDPRRRFWVDFPHQHGTVNNIGNLVSPEDETQIQDLGDGPSIAGSARIKTFGKRPHAHQHPSAGFALVLGSQGESHHLPLMANPGPAATNPRPGAPSPLLPRQDFRGLAHWSPSLKTDANGRAKVSFVLPDDQTAWSLVAIALEGDKRFGRGASAVQVARPLLARAALPRFANPGDRFDAAVIVHNRTDQPIEATVGLNLGDAEPGRGLAAAKEGSLKARQIKLPAGGAVEVAFDVVAQRPGTTSLTFDVRAPGFEDAVKVPLEVIVPVSTQTVAAYGDTTSARAYPMIPPGAVLPDVGGLEVSMASSVMVGLEGGLRYLAQYPHGNLEQITSRALPLVALKGFADSAGIYDTPPQEFVRAAIDTLERHQRSDGSFEQWGAMGDANAYGSVYAMHLLMLARDQGHAVDGQTFQKGLKFLETQVTRSQHTAAAYMAWILAEHDKLKPASLDRLTWSLNRMPSAAVAFMALAAHRMGDADLRRQAILRLTSQVLETSTDAHFVESDQYAAGLRQSWHSNTRTGAIVLLALLKAHPEHPLVPKLARWLLKVRRNGRWSNTQENAWALVALGRYFDIREGDEPDFKARAWMGDEAVFEAAFKGRHFGSHTFKMPMDTLMSRRNGDDAILTVSKEGTGRLYYAMHMSYALASRELTPRSAGFTVKRDYRLSGQDAWQSDMSHRLVFPAGAYVEVRLTVEAPQERHHVVVDDALPSGLEVADDRLRGTGQFPGRVWPGGTVHAEARDERVLFYSHRMNPGTHIYTYTTRTTTRGDFALQPARAEDMYTPDLFGHSASATFVVE